MAAAWRGDQHPETLAVELPDGNLPFQRNPVRGLGLWVLVEFLAANRWGRHSHDHWQVVFVFAPGICDVTWRSPTGRLVKRRLTGGQVWIVPPGWSHTVRWRESADVIVLYIDPEHMEQGGRLRRKVVVATLADYVALQSMLADHCHDLRKFGTFPNGDSDWRVASAGSHLAALFLETHRQFQLGTGALKPLHRFSAAAVAGVRAWVAQRQGGRLPVTQIASEISISPRTLRRIFRTIMGESPERWALGQKARRAKSLLQSGCSIKETVTEGGFADARNLNRVLRTVYEVTASALQPRAICPLRP